MHPSSFSHGDSKRRKRCESFLALQTPVEDIVSYINGFNIPEGPEINC